GSLEQAARQPVLASDNPPPTAIEVVFASLVRVAREQSRSRILLRSPVLARSFPDDRRVSASPTLPTERWLAAVTVAGTVDGLESTTTEAIAQSPHAAKPAMPS